MSKPTVLNFRGTYGSGKTFLARRVMDLYGEMNPHHLEGRKRPLYYTAQHPFGGRNFAVVGSYETVCGGCDTIADATMIFETVDFLQNEGFDVLYESLLLTADVGRTTQYFQGGWNLHVIHIDLPAEVCLESVNQRRAARGQDKPVNPKNLMTKIASARSSCKTLESRGVPIYRLDREQAFTRAIELLGFDLL